MAVSIEHAPERRHTYADLEAMPDDNVIRAIIDGELYVTPAPTTRHQDCVMNLAFLLKAYAIKTGGKAYTAPYGVYFTETNFVEPDLIFIRADRLELNGPKHMSGAPDLVIEISSPSTKRIDLGVKRSLYERLQVPEFWFVDLENSQVEVYALRKGSYAQPMIMLPGESLEPAGLPGLSVPVTEVFHL